MPRTDRLYLVDIINAADAIERYIGGKTLNDLVDDEILTAAVLQKLTVIGEACARISDEMRAKYGSVQWRGIIGLRNVAVHAYFSIEWDVVWNAITTELPLLRSQVQLILTREFSEIDPTSTT